MNNEFGRKVRFYRTRAGRTQLELSTYLGYKTSSSVAKIEDGTNDVLVSVAVRIAEFLNISPRQFFEPIPEDESLRYKAFLGYLPYLAQAEDGDLKVIRKILGMPSVEKKNGGSMNEAVS